MYERIFKNILNPIFESVIKRRNMLKYRGLLEKSQWWPYEKLRSFQWDELTKLLKHAYENVPYWRQHFDRLGLKPNETKTYKDFWKLPIIDKKDIRERYADMHAANYVGKTWKASTGGSTGEPLHFGYTAQSYDWRVAESKRGYGWAGCEDGIKQAYIWGIAIGKTSFLRRLKEGLHHAYLRQKYFNCFKFDEKEMARAVMELNRYKPKIMVGYTNPLYNFARFCKKRNIIKFKPMAIISAAEKLHEFQRKEISDIFGCKVFNTYGSREFMLIASECEKQNGLHVSMENLLVEVIKADGTPANNGEMGDIVITDLHNYGMPFIRYKIGDMAIATDKMCSCGRGLTLLGDVTGRSLDMIKTPDGRYIPGEFFPHLMKEFKNIYKFQVVQDRIDHLLIKIVQKEMMSETERKFLSEEIEKVAGNKIKIDITFINEIPLTSTGKHRVTISNLS